MAGHTAIVAGSGRQAAPHPGLRQVDTARSKLKTTISGTWHAFKFASYVGRYLAEVPYRFNRRFDLKPILARWAQAIALTRPRTENIIGQAEVEGQSRTQMTAAAFSGPFDPENPLRRLAWILPLAVALVLLGVMGLGKMLRTGVHHGVKIKPLDARIYELPASSGAAPAKARPPAHLRSVPTPIQPPSRTVAQAPAVVPATSSAATKGPVMALPRHAAPARTPHTINWAALNSQINAVVQQSVAGQAVRRAVLPQPHNPHTLVARYYIASVLGKLQRIGDMNYPTDLTGVTVLKLVLSSDGQLSSLTLLRSSGNDALDHNAEQIARESAPFAPFPDALKRETANIELICYMSFEGYRRIYTSN